MCCLNARFFAWPRSDTPAGRATAEQQQHYMFPLPSLAQRTPAHRRASALVVTVALVVVEPCQGGYGRLPLVGLLEEGLGKGGGRLGHALAAVDAARVVAHVVLLLQLHAHGAHVAEHLVDILDRRLGRTSNAQHLRHNTRTGCSLVRPPQSQKVMNECSGADRTG